MKSFLLALSLVVLAGCSGDAADTAATGGAPEPSATGTAVSMGKCGFCGAEVASADLVSHDGQMVCKKCMEAHKH